MGAQDLYRSSILHTSKLFLQMCSKSFVELSVSLPHIYNKNCLVCADNIVNKRRKWIALLQRYHYSTVLCTSLVYSILILRWPVGCLYSRFYKHQVSWGPESEFIIFAYEAFRYFGNYGIWWNLEFDFMSIFVILMP